MPVTFLIRTVILWALCLPGCVSVYPAMGDRSGPGSPAAAARPEAAGKPAEPGADRWPARWGAEGAPRGVILPVEERVTDLRPAHLGRFHRLRSGETEYRQAEQLARAVGVEDGFRFEPEGPGALVFMPPLESATPGEAGAGGDDAEVFVFVSAQEAADSTPDDPRVHLERTWFALYDAAAAEPKGTIVLIPGMLGTPQPIIEGMVRYWRNSGYAVLRFLAHPSRFTERVEVPVTEETVGGAGALLAMLYDQRTAECAYAADAALDYAFVRRTGLKDKPVALVGMSGGAMVLPTVFAYAPERYDAAVLIAGGANSLRISALSNYADWIDAVAIDWAPDDNGSMGKPSPDLLGRLSDAYLAASRLDAAHTAPEMTAVPVLVLHAAKDRAVPADTGESLWRLLERPERWVFNVGHEVIFVMLPMQSGRLQAWIDRALGGDPGGEP